MNTSDLPALNAFLNGCAAVLLLLGQRAIKRGDRELHKKWMLSAAVVSALFLACYLTYHALHGATRFTTPGWPRALYLTILGTHTVLAAINLPLIILALVHALRGRFDKHLKAVRFAWPVWVYVSVTGVLIYVMLYQVWPGERIPIASIQPSTQLEQ